MPPAQQQQQSGGGGDDSLAPVWIILLLFVTGYLIWFFAHQYIVGFIFKVNIFEAKLINLFFHNSQLETNIYLMQTIDPATVSWSQFADLSSMIGDYIRYPVIALLVILAIWLYTTNLKLKYRKVHDMKSLRAQEQNNWSGIRPIIKEDLVATDINQGPWAMALTPMEFARRHRILKKEDAVLDVPIPGMEMTAGIHKGDAKRVFTLQLGPYYNGFERCPAHVSALAAVFMARMNRDRASAVYIIDAINVSWSKGSPNYALALPTLKKYINTEIVQEIIQKHAYVLTVIASLLEGARQDGVVASADFLWLKPTDRRLWYMLNSVGRQTPYAEVSGPFAHWKAEKVLGRPSLVPMIDEAIVALEKGVKEVKLSPKELQRLES